MGPGVSALATFCAFTPRLGTSATIKTTIPIPPSHWVSERHSNIDFGRASTSVSIVAPVVEKPEHISKKASITFGIDPCITNGIAAKIEDIIHANETMK